MSVDLNGFDHLLCDENVVALVTCRHLMPIDGMDGVFFPSTYAESTDKKIPPGYNINNFASGDNVCTIDSVQSQSNRIEPLFLLEQYRDLVPQITIHHMEEQKSLLETTHRLADVIIPGTDIPHKELFNAYLRHDAESIAKLNPTAIVFGVWDSRGTTKAKLPRLINSRIDAYNCKKLTRSAAYSPTFIVEADKNWKPTSENGFKQALAARDSHGGVIAQDICHKITLNLDGLRLLKAGSPSKSTDLRRYVLGLALVCYTFPQHYNLRQGCLLVLNPERPAEDYFRLRNGESKPSTITHEVAIKYAQLTAKKFGVGASQMFEFNKELAKKKKKDKEIESQPEFTKPRSPANWKN